MMSSEILKRLIECSISFEEIDELLMNNTPFNSVNEKIAYLCGMFDIVFIDGFGKNIEDDYRVVVDTVLNVNNPPLSH